MLPSLFFIGNELTILKVSFSHFEGKKECTIFAQNLIFIVYGMRK